MTTSLDQLKATGTTVVCDSVRYPKIIAPLSTTSPPPPSKHHPNTFSRAILPPLQSTSLRMPLQTPPSSSLPPRSLNLLSSSTMLLHTQRRRRPARTLTPRSMLPLTVSWLSSARRSSRSSPARSPLRLMLASPSIPRLVSIRPYILSRFVSSTTDQ